MLPTLKSSCWILSSSSSLLSRADARVVTFSSSTSGFCPAFFGLASSPSSFCGLRWVSGGDMPRDFWVRESSIASLLKYVKMHTVRDKKARQITKSGFISQILRVHYEGSWTKKNPALSRLKIVASSKYVTIKPQFSGQSLTPLPRMNPYTIAALITVR